MTTHRPIKLFVSYSHRDERLRRQLQEHLHALKSGGLIEEWHDRKIVPGQEWEGVINENLENSGIILLLVSSSFIASEYCNDMEMARALERHDSGEARVIPVILRPVDWRDARFACLQALPTNGRPVTKWSNRDEAWLTVSRGIREAAEDLRSRPETPRPVEGARHYRKAVESVWADERLNRQELEWLDEYATAELGLSPSEVSAIECEVMGASKEAIIEHQAQLAEDRYRTAVEEAWADNKLSDAEADQLGYQASELGLGEDRVVEIERMVMGDTAQGILRHQAEKERRLDDMYDRARRLQRDRKWQEVADVLERIRDEDPAYPDREGMLESAREALDLERRAATAYERGLRHSDAREWRQALERFEEVQRLDPDYQDNERHLARALRELAEEDKPRTPWDYVDFGLEIDQTDEPRKYTVISRSPEGETREEMRFPYDEWELKDKLRDLEVALLRSGGTRRNISAPEDRTARDLGRALFETLLVGEVRARYEANMREAKRQNRGLRLKLHVRPPELSALPWEFLYDPDRDYLCLSSKTPLVRYLDLPQPVERLRVRPPLKVLGMVASPIGLAPLDIEHEKRLVEEATRDLRADGMLELTWLEGQSWRDLQRIMRRDEWHIFHFVGHGGFDPVSGGGAIALADEKGNTHLLAAKRLTRLLDDQYPLRMVFLNSCEGARGSERDAFSSTAATLVRCGIPAVVAMQYEITDAAAIEFSRSFYEAVADGLPVDAAVAEARTAVSMESMLEWGTPVLYMRSPDGRIFDILPPQNRLEMLYAQARRSSHSQDWQAVIDAFGKIYAEAPAYPDPEGLLARARRALAASEPSRGPRGPMKPDFLPGEQRPKSGRPPNLPG